MWLSWDDRAHCDDQAHCDDRAHCQHAEFEGTQNGSFLTKEHLPVGSIRDSRLVDSFVRLDLD
jgi:hypothetical protein